MGAKVIIDYKTGGTKVLDQTFESVNSARWFLAKRYGIVGGMEDKVYRTPDGNTCIIVEYKGSAKDAEL